MPEGDPMLLLRRALSNENVDRSDLASALLLIVYRYRNNLFHGEKWLYQMRDQNDNFAQANSVLMRAIELCRRL
jgi:hypothetical protein